MTAAFEATALSKRYGRKWALRGCTVSIPAGCTVALVGPNGAGKTTLMSLAMGFLQPNSGEIRIRGCSPREMPSAVLAQTGYLAQDRPLYRHLTVAQMLKFGRALNPRWDGALAITRLHDLGIQLDQRVGRLSGGQHARVALTLALAKRHRAAPA